jgi:uroporphyrinogen-III synthase
MIPTSLSGLRVLVTRPEAQAQSIIEALKQQGANTWHFPLVQIAPINSPSSSKLHDRLPYYDIAIFISPTAVSYFANALGKSLALPKTLKIACIGSGSAREFNRNFARVADILPAESDIQDTEALLKNTQLTEKSIQNKNVLIIRGKGGREKLATELRQRKANVDYLELYQRLKPSADPSPLLQSIAAHQLNVIIIYSSEALHNLMELVAEPLRHELLKIPLVTIHPRQVKTAETYGFAHIYLSQGATVENMINTLKTIN